MNRRISMVLAAIAASAVATPALAQDPGKMFMINAVTPGVVSFSGEGTAQFNNASTTANAFSVGSSTNFGVNASASSTLDYMVDANALLQLAGTSQLQQTIGTSSSAANTQAASEAAMTAATTVADRETNETFGSTFADYVARNGGSAADITAAGTGDGIVSNGVGESYQGDYTSTAQYDAAKNSFFNEKVNENFSNTVNTANESASANNNADGTISGVFDSSSFSRSQIGATASAVQSYTETATQEADAAFGSSYDGVGEGSYTAQFDALDTNDNGLIDDGAEAINANAAGLAFNAGTGAQLTQENWSSAKQAAIDSTVADMTNSASSNGDSESKNNATVNVQGVGSIATLNASEDSAFNVDVATRIRTQLMTTNGTANGSAGGNLATSSFANQSLSQSASAFIQAFGADTVSLSADQDGNLTGATVSGRLNVGIGVGDLYGQTAGADTANDATDDTFGSVGTNLTVTVPAE